MIKNAKFSGYCFYMNTNREIFKSRSRNQLLERFIKLSGQLTFFSNCHALRGKYPNTKFFLVRVFPCKIFQPKVEYGDLRNKSPLFSPNARIDGPEKTPYLDNFRGEMPYNNGSQ